MIERSTQKYINYHGGGTDVIFEFKDLLYTTGNNGITAGLPMFPVRVTYMKHLPYEKRIQEELYFFKDEFSDWRFFAKTDPTRVLAAVRE
jgi:hypothetical protein